MFCVLRGAHRSQHERKLLWDEHKDDKNVIPDAFTSEALLCLALHFCFTVVVFFCSCCLNGLFCILCCFLPILNTDNNRCASCNIFLSRTIISLFTDLHPYWSATTEKKKSHIQERHESGAHVLCRRHDHTGDIHQSGWWLCFEVTRRVVAWPDTNESHWSRLRPTLLLSQITWHPGAIYVELEQYPTR